MTHFPKNRYDIIIAGGGAAGLSLAYRLSRSSLSGKKVLIIDKDSKKSNDRTWSFWCVNNDVFPEIIHKSWNKIVVKTHFRESVMDIHPYQYKTIRGIDFYNYVKRAIAQNAGFTFLQDEITCIREEKDHAIVETTENSYSAALVFNSLPPSLPHQISQNQNVLLQHFKGYVIEAAGEIFDNGRVHFMDFSVDQQNETRFGYVLPFSKTTALVEFTIFSESLLSDEEYATFLTKYIGESLKIKDYKVLEEEFGVIPMTDIPFRKRDGKRIFNIGARGGMTKASTGYTFTRIQQECKAIVSALEKTYPKISLKARRGRFHFYDRVLLHVLAGRLCPADQIFFRLFTRNKPQTMLRFLEEKTSLSEDLRILSTVPQLPFIKGVFRALFSRGFKKNWAKEALEQRLQL